MFDAEIADRSPHPSLRAMADANLELLSNTLAHAQQSGRVAAGPVIDYAAAMWALTHGLANFLVDGQLRRFGYTAKAANTIAPRLFAILREGLIPR
jgi:hypothetical protein